VNDLEFQKYQAKEQANKNKRKEIQAKTAPQSYT
jgi:hypothetical protein